MHERIGIGETLGGSEQLLHIWSTSPSAPTQRQTGIEDPAIRQQIAQFACEVAAKKYSGMRSLTKRLKGLPPGRGSLDFQDGVDRAVAADGEILRRACSVSMRCLSGVRHWRPMATGCGASSQRIDDDCRRHLGGTTQHDRRANLGLAQGLSPQASKGCREGAASARPLFFCDALIAALV